MDSYFINFSGLYSRDRLSLLSLADISCRGGTLLPPAPMEDMEEDATPCRGGTLLPPTPIHDVLDLSGLEGTCCYCDTDAEDAIRRAIASIPSRAVHFIDSGDYHYVSKLFTDRVSVPFSLVLFDNHPDMQPPAFGDILSCGGWVRKVLGGNPLLQRIIIIGSDPALAEETEDFCVNDTCVRDIRVGKGSCPSRERVILLPTDVEPSVLTSLVAGRNIYISIDKDVMTREYARTDWSQGTMTLPQLLGLLRALTSCVGQNDTRVEAMSCSASASTHLLGVDVCGGLAESKGGQPEDFRINACSDIAIVNVFAHLVRDICEKKSIFATHPRRKI